MARTLDSARRLGLLAPLLTLLACDASLGSVASETGATEEGASTNDSGSAEPLPCIGGELCPDGSSCANNVCATDCSGDDQCQTDEWCADDLCQPDEVPTCKDDDDCVGPQVCLSNLCVSIGDEQCDPYDFVLDSCPSNALCREGFIEEVGYCYELPACAEDGSCPIGIVGAVCNLDTLPNKDQVCLIGFCDTVAHCPDSWFCVRYAGEPLGACADGTFGSPCTTGEHCLSGTCVPIPAAGGGLCQ